MRSRELSEGKNEYYEEDLVSVLLFHSLLRMLTDADERSPIVTKEESVKIGFAQSFKYKKSHAIAIYIRFPCC